MILCVHCKYTIVKIANLLVTTVTTGIVEIVI